MNFYTIPQLAKDMSVNERKIREWIDSGQLKAINVSQGEQRPRYRISQAQLDAFCKLRETSNPTSKPKRRKRRTGRKFIQ